MTFIGSKDLGVRILIGSAIGALLVAASLAALPTAKAATLTVTTLAEAFDGVCDSNCSPRDASSARDTHPLDNVSFLRALEYVSSLPSV